MRAVTITSPGGTVRAAGQKWRASATSSHHIVSVSISIASGPPYDGACDVTPSCEAQTLATRGKLMPADVTVQPIPSNYGLITWDGRTLTVS